MGASRKSRSVQATPQGQENLKAAKAAKTKFNEKKDKEEIWTFRDISEVTKLDEKTVKNFFYGIRVDETSAIAIVKALDLDLKDIINDYTISAIISTQESRLALDTFNIYSHIDENKLSYLNLDKLNKFGYIERPPIEEECYKTIVQDGALIRVKAPHLMGKTLLLNKIIDNVRQDNYRTITISFDAANSSILGDINKFSRWFCAKVSKELSLGNKIDDYWDDDFGCNDNVSTYFEDYLFAQISDIIVLALDKLDRVFEQPAIADDFCRLLRAWNDIAKRNDKRGSLWKKLRLIILHSTEVYGSLDINYSPLANVGKILPLPEFSFEQVENLAKIYQIDWISSSEIELLMSMLGGHPYLLTQAFEYLKSQKVTLLEFLEIAPTEESPFSNHLRKQLWTLEENPELSLALAEVVRADEPIRLKPSQAFKLESMGLIKLNRNYCIPRCNLYRQYFFINLVYK